jgi:hypothetical protein
MAHAAEGYTPVDTTSIISHIGRSLVSGSFSSVDPNDGMATLTSNASGSVASMSDINLAASPLAGRIIEGDAGVRRGSDPAAVDSLAPIAEVDLFTTYVAFLIVYLNGVSSAPVHVFYHSIE